MTKPERLPQLDGLRGIAALMVAVYHSYKILSLGSDHAIQEQSLTTFTDISHIITRSIFVVTNGEMAVVFFFLLSGFVLSRSLEKSGISLTSIVSFYVKRFFRIYPVFFVVIVVTMFILRGDIFLRNFPYTSEWFNSLVNCTFSLKELISNLLFRSVSLSSVSWTLKVEVWVSLLFPFLFLLSTRISRFLNIAVLIALMVGAYYIPHPDYIPYMYIFYLGIIMSSFKDIFNTLVPMKNKYKNILFIGGIVLFFIVSENITRSIRLYIESFIGWGIIGLIVYGDFSSLNTLLRHRYVNLLGKISYPFYLTHFLVLYVFTLVLFTYFPIQQYLDYSLFIHTFIMIATISIAIGISVLLHKYIEIPMISIGRKIGSSLSIRK
jgi:peptidoglycan/LPS O-acetylase OafA/YrhL